MFSVDLDQLSDIPGQITGCVDVVDDACGRLYEVRSVIMEMKTLESAIPKIARISAQLIDQADSLIRMSRTLDMAVTHYRQCESRVRNNCSGTTRKTYPAKIVSIPGLPQYLTGSEE